MDIALKDAEAQSKTSDDGSRDFNSPQGLSSMMNLLSQVPGTGDLARQAADLQAMSDVQERTTAEPPFGAGIDTRFAGPPGSEGGPPGPNIPGTSIDPMKTAAQIYPYVFSLSTSPYLSDLSLENYSATVHFVHKTHGSPYPQIRITDLKL